MPAIAPRPRAVLITGCSSGFGRAAALRLLGHGWSVLATVRKPADADSLAAEVEKAHGADARERLRIVICDLVEPAGLDALSAALADQPALDAVVNNAGTALAGPIELLPVDDLRRVFEINVLAQVAVAQRALKLLKQSRGRLINVSSISGRIATPLLGAYCASKYALEALSDALRLELAPLGVRVVVIEPGASATAIWETTRRRAEQLERARKFDAQEYDQLIAAFDQEIRRAVSVAFPPEEFARVVELILNKRHPRPRYTVPRLLKAAIFGRGLLPDRWWDALVRWRLGW